MKRFNTEHVKKNGKLVVDISSVMTPQENEAFEKNMESFDFGYWNDSRYPMAVSYAGITKEILVTDVEGYGETIQVETMGCFAWCPTEKGVLISSKKGEEHIICGLIWIDSVIEYGNSSELYVVIKGVNEMLGGFFKLTVKLSDLSQNKGIIKSIIDHGGYINPEYVKFAQYYLHSLTPRNLVYAAQNTGWYKHNKLDKNYFILPKIIIGEVDSNYTIKYLPKEPSSAQESIHERGTLGEWQEHIGNKCCLNKAPLFFLGVSFSAPLGYLLKLDGGGFHAYGLSSSGKTTLLQIASSIYGNADDPANCIGEGIIQRWLTTANGMESTGMAFSDLLTAMDEVGTSTDKDFGSSIYNYCGGVGKVRATSTGAKATQRNWRATLLSSGEYPIYKQIEYASGNEAKAGQMVRVIEILIEENMFEHTEGLPPSEFATNLKEACADYYGTPAIPYLEYLVAISNDRVLHRQLLKDYNETIRSLKQEGMHPLHERALKRFASVYMGLKLAIDIKLIPCTHEDAMESVKYVLNNWLENNAMISDVDRGVEATLTFIRTNQSRFRNARDSTTVKSNIVGYKDSRRGLYIIMKPRFDVVCGRTNVKEIVKKFDELGLLFKNNKDNKGAYRLISKHRIEGAGSVDAYAISFKALGEEPSGSVVGRVLPKKVDPVFSLVKESA